MAKLDEERTQAHWCEHGLPFPSTCGTLLEPRNLVRHFKQVLAAAQLPDIPFYNLRHSCATLLVQLGEHPRIIQAILRHASFHTTMAYYAHAVPAIQRSAVESLRALLMEPDRLDPPTETLRRQHHLDLEDDHV